MWVAVLLWTLVAPYVFYRPTEEIYFEVVSTLPAFDREDSLRGILLGFRHLDKLLCSEWSAGVRVRMGADELPEFQ